MCRCVPAIVLSGVLLLLLAGAFRPYRASTRIMIELLDPEGARPFIQDVDLQVREFSSISTGDLKALLSANGLSVKVDELSIRPRQSGQRGYGRLFQLTVYNVDRYAAAAQANAAGRIATRELRGLHKLRIVRFWGDVDPPPIHLEQELFQRMLLTANR
jgi:hypothetical protein